MMDLSFGDVGGRRVKRPVIMTQATADGPCGERTTRSSRAVRLAPTWSRTATSPTTAILSKSKSELITSSGECTVSLCGCRYKVAGNRFNVIGRCDPSLRTYSVWLRPLAEYENEGYSSEEYHKGIVYYLLPDDRLAGVLLWNMPDEEGLKEDRAISVIKSRRPFDGNTVQSAITIGDKDYFID